MIIRTTPHRNFTSLPNAMLRDRRLSIETKGALAYLLSLPDNWEIRPSQVAAELSQEERPLGLKRLYRIFAEMREAGYMARSDAQGRGETGGFGSYVYIVGPDKETVSKAVEECSVANLPHGRFVHAQNDRASNKINISNKPTPTPSDPPSGETAGSPIEETRQSSRSHKGRRAFVFIPSRPWTQWVQHLTAHGGGGEPMPVPVVRVVKGQQRTGAWMPSYRPPGALVRFSELAAQITASELKPSPLLIRSLRVRP